MLKRQGLISTWHDRRIGAGDHLDHEISQQMEDADVILLLVSSDFLASDYCYDKEMTRALERHQNGEAKVVPVILRACDWQNAPFGQLMATPTDGKPITKWADRDEALLEVSKAIRQAVATFSAVGQPPEFKSVPGRHDDRAEVDQPRSSNLRIKKEFTERDRDRFKVETFDYIARFFENSLEELDRRNADIECEFRRLDANRFTAAIYKSGNAAAKCTIFMGGDRYLGRGISFVHGESSDTNSYSESLSVSSDDTSMYLSGSGFSSMRMRGEGGDHLSQQGAAEFYWAMLMQPLQEFH